MKKVIRIGRAIELELRCLDTQENYRACVELQRQTWGDDFNEIVPPTVLKVVQKMGGILAGAFNEHEQLIGFVFGLTGLKNGKSAHWSHMLAVVEEYRGLGLGRELKLYQRELLLQQGINIMYWTFDPLVARNAHLNLNKLAADIEEYVPDMYGSNSGSKLHRGVGLDRFIVAWHLAEKKVEQAIAGDIKIDISKFVNTPVVNLSSLDKLSPIMDENEIVKTPAVRIEIPTDVYKLQSESINEAIKWRASTKRPFINYLKYGYKITNFYREQKTDRCFYVLSK